MIEMESKSDCSGCGACGEICPVSAIVMRPDEEGFLYPSVNEDECVRCGKCVSVCPIVSKRKDVDEKGIIAYAAKTKREEVLLNSSSGGIFTEIATRILDENGIVFGAAFDESFGVRHIAIDRVSDLDKLRGSKYLQSEIASSYSEARNCLEQGKTVLFTGTPCQIGGLYSFLDKDYDNLITQDIICHGVPSPTVWKRYVEYREAKTSSKTRKAFFRNKKYGWKSYSMQFEFENSKKYSRIASEDPYMRGFLNNLCLRPSCYECYFKSKARMTDITLADCWGIENICPELDDDRGTSLVIINSPKGRLLFDEIKLNLEYRKVDFEEAVRYNSAMTASATKNPCREAFIACVCESGFKIASKKYLTLPLKIRIKKSIKKIFKKLQGVN